MRKRILLFGLVCLFSTAAVSVVLDQPTQAGNLTASASLSMTPLSPTASQWIPFHVRAVVTNTDVVSSSVRWELYSPPNAILLSADGAFKVPPLGLPEYVYWSGVLSPSHSHVMTAHFQVGIPPLFPAHPDTVVITSTLFDPNNNMKVIAQETATVIIVELSASRRAAHAPCAIP